MATKSWGLFRLITNTAQQENKRQHIALTNLQVCFAKNYPAQHQALLKKTAMEAG
jgi:lauroyl/myristoyl acyltransferase